MQSDKLLKKILTFSLYSTAFLPLVFWSPLFYPFMGPKVLFFRTMVVISFSLFLILFSLGKISIEKEVLKKKAIWLPAIFLISSYISAIFGLDFINSFWSDFNRMEGLLTLTHIVLYFYLLLFSFSKENWRNFLYIVSFVSIIVAISAILEGMGIATFTPDGGRIGGTINNAAFLSSYLLFTLPLTLYLALENKEKSKIFYLFLSGALLSIFTIFASGTRGAVIGLFGALFILLILSIFISPNKKIKKYSSIFIIVLIILSSIGFSFRDSLKESNILVIRRLAQISLQDGTTISRLFIWKNVLPKVLERPIIGHGQENFEYIYNYVYNPYVVDEEWFDRSHNVYIDQILNGGIVGFVLYMSLFFVLMREIWKIRDKDKIKFYLFSFLVIAYMGQNFFVFDSINTLFLFFAILAFFLKPEKEGGEAIFVTKNNIAFLSSLFILSILSMSSIYFFQIIPLRANVLLSEGYTYQIVDISRFINAWNAGISLAPQYKKDFGYQAYDAYYNKINENVGQDKIAEGFHYSVSVLKNAIEEYPLDVRLRIYLAHILGDRPDGVPLDEELFFETVETAIELSPKRKQPHYILANYYFSKVGNTPYLPHEKKDFDEAIEVLDSYSEILSESPEPKLVLANILVNNREYEKGEKYFNEALLVYKPDPILVKRILSYYIAINDYISVEPFFEYAIDVNPNNVDLLFDLAHVYDINGKKDLAKETLIKIRDIDDSIFSKDPLFVKKILGE